MTKIMDIHTGNILFESLSDSIRGAVEEAVRRGISLASADLFEANLVGLDLVGVDFSSAKLGYADLRGADLSGA